MHECIVFFAGRHSFIPILPQTLNLLSLRLTAMPVVVTWLPVCLDQGRDRLCVLVKHKYVLEPAARVQEKVFDITNILCSPKPPQLQDVLLPWPQIVAMMLFIGIWWHRLALMWYFSKSCSRGRCVKSKLLSHSTGPTWWVQGSLRAMPFVLWAVFMSTRAHRSPGRRAALVSFYSSLVSACSPCCCSSQKLISWKHV